MNSLIDIVAFLTQKFPNVRTVRFSDRKTPARVGTHETKLPCINRRRKVRVLKGFRKAVESASTIQDVRRAVAGYILVSDQQLAETQVYLIGTDRLVQRGQIKLK